MILMFEGQKLSAFMKVDITWSIYDNNESKKLFKMFSGWQNLSLVIV